MVASGTPTGGILVFATEKSHEKAIPHKAQEAQGSGCRRFLSKGGDTADKAEGQMAVGRRYKARQPGTSYQSSAGDIGNQLSRLTGVNQPRGQSIYGLPSTI